MVGSVVILAVWMACSDGDRHGTIQKSQLPHDTGYGGHTRLRSYGPGCARSYRSGSRPGFRMSDTVFFTGFPGFLGAELLPRILSRDPDVTARVFVQPKFVALARERI